VSEKRWLVDLDGTRHEIVLRHGYFSARRQLSVDGREVLDIRPDPFNAIRLWNTATEHAFVVAGHACVVRIDPTIDNATYKKFLIVDGRDAESGAPRAVLRAAADGTREGRWMAGYGGISGFVVRALAAIIGLALLRAWLEGLLR